MTRTDQATVVGRWSKAAAEGCQEAYPDEIEFFEGTYLGSTAPGGGFPRWDAGTYQRVADDRIRIATSSDELVTYACTVSADRLVVLAEPDCRLEYRRLLQAPEVNPDPDNPENIPKEPS